MVCLLLCTVCVALHALNPLLFLGSSPRCPTNHTQVTVEESGSSLRARFSAALQVDYRYFFLHCSLSLCDQRSSSCTPVCSGRKSRSVSDTVLLKPIAIGPISWAQSLE
ncbi:uromodulin-like [Salvelinus fontinalis]|uniref:uromodulin-like n=1 Tax=Salvelinus fontinalis TaxID=8038 RepID=UPI0024862613|nr:uromodulin-like [Salvelinus fontinalis]